MIDTPYEPTIHWALKSHPRCIATCFTAKSKSGKTHVLILSFSVVVRVGRPSKSVGPVKFVQHKPLQVFKVSESVGPEKS